jgi:predicted nucleic acid-binding protein
MSSSSFSVDLPGPFVADASVVINLNATLRAREIIRAFPNHFLVTENACSELEEGLRHGHRDFEHLLRLIEAGHIRRVRIGVASLPLYEALVDGSASHTLDDGEAATIVCAQELKGIALIDERKARTLCARSFPGLIVASTVDILIHEAVASTLGVQGQSDAVANALMNARMRVPPEHLERVKEMIGSDRASLCASLPKSVRIVPGS